VSAMETIIQIYLVENRIPQMTGNRYEFIYPYDTFRAKNGWVIIAVGNNKLWEVFCNAINRNDLLSDATLKDNYDRVKKHVEVKHIVEAWTESRDVKEIVDFFIAKQIPCAPLYNVKDVVEDPHIAGARRMIRSVEHPIAGVTKLVGSPINLSETPAEIYSPAPLLGEHTDEVLKDVLNYSDSQIALLRDDKVIA
jgi:formyl-CoA transferase